jgi:hypothetical protein
MHFAIQSKPAKASAPFGSHPVFDSEDGWRAAMTVDIERELEERKTAVPHRIFPWETFLAPDR